MEKSESKIKVVSTMLEKHGLLLMTDLKLPSLVSLIVGEPLQKSWWGHPMGKVIFAIGNQLIDRDDVIAIKLISGKVTFVQERLFPLIISIGSAEESWQIEKLSEPANCLFKKVKEHQMLETNALTASSDLPNPAKSCGELEKRLLVYAEEFHTPSGAHAKRLRSWNNWADSRNLDGTTLNSTQAKHELEKTVSALNAEFNGKGTLPWSLQKKH